jgi:hypothetical protein
MQLLISLLFSALAQQAPESARASPPPDHFDAAHTAWVRTYEPELGEPGTRCDPERLVLGAESAPGEEALEPRWMPSEGDLCGGLAGAVTRVSVPEDEVRFVRAPGVRLVVVNGEPFMGDPEMRGGLGVPVFLNKWRNRIWVVDVRGGSQLQLWKPMTPVVMASWLLECSEWKRGKVGIQADLSVPIFNASIEPREYGVHFHWGRALDPRVEIGGMEQWADGGFAAPLGLMDRRSLLFDHEEPYLTWLNTYVGASDVPDLLRISAALGKGASLEDMGRRSFYTRPAVVLVYEQGLLSELISDSYLAGEEGESVIKYADIVITFGISGGEAGDDFTIGPPRFGEARRWRASVRGGGPEALLRAASELARSCVKSG